jgi:DNA-binding IclR family transcriptional regulator
MPVGGRSKEEAKGYSSGGVDAVDRALAILATFDKGHERQSLGDLATKTGLYKSTILRLARSLEVAGFLHREEGGTFVLGAELLRLAAVYRRVPALESRVRPVLQALRAETGESASFFRREGDRRQCLYREETRRAIRDQLMEGDLLPLNVDASGHVLTVFGDPLLPASERTQRYAELPFASFGESDPEMAVIAAPVFSSDGLAGALSISGPRNRLTPARAAEIGPLIVAKAEALSTLLGAASPLTSRTKRARKTAEI